MKSKEDSGMGKATIRSCKSSTRLRTWLTVVLGLALMAFLHMGRGEASEPIREGPLTLSVEDCIRLTLARNLDIKIESYAPLIQEAEVEKEKAAFEPVASFSAVGNKLFIEPSNVLQGVFLRRSDRLRQEGLDLGFTLGQRLVTGGNFQVAYGINRFETNSIFQVLDPTYFSELSFSLNQPLLRDFGTGVNRSRIRIATHNKQISEYDLELKAIELVSRSQEIYWNLHLGLELLKVRKQSLKLAQDLLERNRALLDVGTLPPVELLQSEAGVAAREESVVSAENVVHDAEDVLKEALNLPLDNQQVILSDRPTFESVRIAPEESLKKAFERRPELKQAMKNLESVKISLAVAKNQLLPRLDLQASYGLNGLGGGSRSSFDELGTGDYYSWVVGINVEIPLGNKWAKNNYRESQLRIKQAESALKSVKRKMELEVRESIREIDSSLKRIDSAQKSRTLAERRLEAEEERLSLGMSTTLDVLGFQDSVAAAQTREIQALIDYHIARVVLEAVEGVILDAHGIDIVSE
jgi:outer membrane protein TolC